MHTRDCAGAADTGLRGTGSYGLLTVTGALAWTPRGFPLYIPPSTALFPFPHRAALRRLLWLFTGPQLPLPALRFAFGFPPRSYYRVDQRATDTRNLVAVVAPL